MGIYRQVAIAQSKRVVKFNIVANSLGIHIPYMGALNEMLPDLGYGQPQIDRISRLETITQSILTGSAEVGSGDAISVLRAVQAGADLKIIGNCFMNTDLVFVANAETVKTDRDLEKPNVSVAVNSVGDFTNVILVKPLEKRGIDIKKVNVIAIGGSGTRLRALVAGKIDAVPIHYDQAQELVATGKFRILVEPWKEFDNFLGEVWIVSSAWLTKPENQRAGIDLLKAVVLGFRRADKDFAVVRIGFPQIRNGREHEQRFGFDDRRSPHISCSNGQGLAGRHASSHGGLPGAPANLPRGWRHQW